MPTPQNRNARLFYRSAKKRMEEAALLHRFKMTTGAVYLAGYGVECMLKALILSRIPASAQSAALERFQGAKAHQFEWLLDQYAALGGERLPPAVHQQFQLVRLWTTRLRYDPGTMRPAQADSFLAAVRSIIEWADGRL